TLGSGRWQFFPWDLDLTFGRNYNSGGVLNDVIWANVDSIPGRNNVSPSHPLFGNSTHQKYDFIFNNSMETLYSIPKTRDMFFRRLRTVMDQELISGKYEARIDELLAPVGPEVDLDHAKWPQFGQAQSLATAVTALKNEYLALRRTHLFTTHRVAGEIPAAQSPTPRIVINELMYHPVGDDTLGEFVELYNPSSTESVDLSNWRIDGVALTIPAGTVILPSDFVLFVRNDAGFRATYGGHRYIGGQYSGELSNQGEQISLRDPGGRLVDEVSYEDVAPWPTSADGAGMSLERIDPNQPGSLASNWAASLAAGGTPGAVNSRAGTLATLPALSVNEVLPVNTAINRDDHDEFAPWIELYNPSAETIDLSGLYLTDNYSQPLKWPIPSGSQLCPGQWMLIWADNQPAQGPLHTNFALSGAGGSVGLYSGSSVLIDYLNYPALGANFSYGRFPDGSLNRVQFETPTPSAANNVARAPVILNEYNAVATNKFIKNGGSDTYFGHIVGNGGDWFELVVTQNHLDMRGWQLVATDNTGPSQTTYTLVLTNQSIWSDLRAGTIITVCESVPDDVSYDPANGDWWINVRAGTSGTGVYISAIDFEVDQRNWQLTIKNAQGQVMFGPAGEGVQPASGIGDDEVFKLEEDPSEFIGPHSNYNDGSSSTFGSPNLFNSGTQSQDFSALRSQLVLCKDDGQCADDDPCTIDACVNGECYHTTASPCYRLSLDVSGDVGGQVSTCPGSLDVQLNLSGLVSPINGVQVLLRYNTSRLSLQSITAGNGSGSPWDSAMQVSFSDNSGSVTYALVLVGGGTTTNATVATLHFTALPPGDVLASTQVIFDTPPSCSVFKTKLTTSTNATIFPTTVDSGQINVGPRVTVDIDVEGLTHAVTRDVTFTLTDCSGPSSQTLTRPVSFNASGHGSVVLTSISPQASWISISEGHTLRKRLPLVFYSCFATVACTGADHLVAGDLQTTGVPQDNLVDILDFAILAARWNTMVSDCVSGLPADCSYGADINGDGAQDTADFVAIQMNFFKTGDDMPACPPHRLKFGSSP
ncbi:MAG TPA: lamin tail domain-containing protein, partial [Phycisphaerae bacterium]|nr:lamin tail domain-containing protein [Phycisphaerae bacterium]